MEERRPVVQLAIGLASAFALMATLIAPLWMIELVLVGLSVWFVWWMGRAPFLRLASPRRIPRLMIFGPLALGIAANVYLVSTTSRVALAINLVVFVAAALVGMYRIVKAPVPPTGPLGTIPR